MGIFDWGKPKRKATRRKVEKRKYSKSWILVDRNVSLANVRILKSVWRKSGVKSKVVKTANGYTVYNKPIER